MYENFNAPSTESLDSIFNWLHKIVSQLAILGENISQEDLNLKFLRSLPSKWNTHVLVWRNKPDLDTMSFDDLYNNFMIVKQEVKRTVTTSSSTGSQNMAFVSSPGSTNKDSPSVRVLGKTAYVGHIRLLKKPHKWRRSLEFNGETENEDPPREFSRDAIMTQLARLPTHVKGKHPRHRQGKTRLEKPGHSKWLVAQPKQKREVLEASGYEMGSDPTSSTKSPIMMPQYLPPDVTKPLIELCLFFKQICSQTLMVDDMLKAQSKVIDILCNLELIYPPAFFDIMIHLVIHLHLEAIFGGPIRPRWMYPFERYMKKQKNYVRNKAKLKGSIAEGYVAEEALTFSSHYFRDVTTKFNRPDRNVDCPPSTCQFQVFKSLCKSIGLRPVVHIDHQELKKVIWYVLHNSPEIDTYRAKFKSEFPDNDMKEAFPGWFGKQIRQCHVDNDPGVSESSELFALACGPSQTLISVNSCVVNGVRFVVHSSDEHRTTQNSGICSAGPDGEMYYGQLEQILEFLYLSFKTVLFRVKWFDTSNKGRMQNLVIRNNITQIKENGEAFKNDQCILATQVKQCFYLEDMARRPLGWKVVEHVSHKIFLNGGVIVVKDNPDVIHVDNSSDLALSTSLNDLEIAALHIDGQSIDVDAWNGYLTKRRKTKQKATKPDTGWKSV
ncbi:reverse transcriptase domain-containing protein [Tanacetum coccineum]